MREVCLAHTEGIAAPQLFMCLFPELYLMKQFTSSGHPTVGGHAFLRRINLVPKPDTFLLHTPFCSCSVSLQLCKSQS